MTALRPLEPSLKVKNPFVKKIMITLTPGIISREYFGLPKAYILKSDVFSMCFFALISNSKTDF